MAYLNLFRRQQPFPLLLPITRQTNHLVKRIMTLQVIHQKTLFRRETLVSKPTRAADATKHGMQAVIPGLQLQATKETAGIERLRKRGHRRPVIPGRYTIHPNGIPQTIGHSTKPNRTQG